MSKQVVRIWTDVEVDANTEEGAIMAAAAKAIQDGGETIRWQFMVLMPEEEYEALMKELEKTSVEHVEAAELVEKNDGNS